MQKSYDVTMSTSSGNKVQGVACLRRNHEFPLPTSTNFTVGDYIRKYREGFWKLPFMQRNPDTWPDDHYRELIESIFNNIVTSPFIGSMHDALDIKLLDGGHRTEAILRFIDNKFPITCPTTEEDRTFSELTVKDRTIFMDKGLLFLIYQKLSPHEEEFLYFRINNSLPFTPGEVVNGYSTIPICSLARDLGDVYAPRLKKLFVRGVEGNNLRADSSNLMFTILGNFYHKSIVKGEKTSKNDEIKKSCESYRYKDIDSERLKYNVECLFQLLDAKRNEHPHLLMMLPTVQEIMMKHDVGMNRETDRANRKVLRFVDILARFFSEIEKPSHALNARWQGLKRKPDNDTIKGVQNPSKPTNCVKRAEIFTDWLKMNT